MENKENQTLHGEFVIHPPDSNETNMHQAETTITNPTPPSNNSTTTSHNHPHSKAHFYTAYCEYPTNVTFPDQDPDEEIALLIRRHFVTNVPWIAVAAVAFFIPIASPFFISLLPFLKISAITQTAALLFYYLALFGYILVNFSIWYFHTSLITTKRIIDMDLDNILSKHVAETRIDLVQDVSYTQIGAIRSVFNYGDVFVQTAGTLANIEFDKAPKPAMIAKILGDLIQEFKK